MALEVYQSCLNYVPFYYILERDNIFSLLIFLAFPDQIRPNVSIKFVNRSWYDGAHIDSFLDSPSPYSQNYLIVRDIVKLE